MWRVGYPDHPSQLFARRFWITGEAIGPAIRIDAANDEEEIRPAIAASAKGKVVFAWEVAKKHPTENYIRYRIWNIGDGH
jgi:hypothetical protein